MWPAGHVFGSPALYYVVSNRNIVFKRVSSCSFLNVHDYRLIFLTFITKLFYSTFYWNLHIFLSYVHLECYKDFPILLEKSKHPINDVLWMFSIQFNVTKMDYCETKTLTLTKMHHLSLQNSLLLECHIWAVFILRLVSFVGSSPGLISLWGSSIIDLGKWLIVCRSVRI